jgi:acyl carrier protein
LNSIEDFIITTLVTKYRVPEDKVSPDSDISDLGVDSLTIVEMFLMLEDKLGVSIPDEAILGAKTIRDAASAVQTLTAKAA